MVVFIILLKLLIIVAACSVYFSHSEKVCNSSTFMSTPFLIVLFSVLFNILLINFIGPIFAFIIIGFIATSILIKFETDNNANKKDILISVVSLLILLFV